MAEDNKETIIYEENGIDVVAKVSDKPTKETIVYDSNGNEIDRMVGNPYISGKMYEKHLPIRVVYKTDDGEQIHTISRT